MTWTVGDFALIITTATTAITAITGVGLPLWRDYVAKRDQRKEDVFRRISEAVYFCVEYIDDARDFDKHNAMALALMNDNLTPRVPMKRLQSQTENFHVRLG